MAITKPNDDDNAWRVKDRPVVDATRRRAWAVVEKMAPQYDMPGFVADRDYDVMCNWGEKNEGYFWRKLQMQCKNSFVMLTKECKLIK